LTAGLLAGPIGETAPAGALGYVRQIPLEAPAERAERHRRVAERRAGTVVMVHRGAAAFAPENTLEAYAAAMDYGADGCEIDIRRTADGVLVLFHDDMLDQLTEGFGTVEQVTYYELLSLRRRFVYGTAAKETRPPTLAAVLALALQRAMLLHLDIKRPGLEADISRMLDEADAWDHVVAVNTSTAPALARDPRVKLLAYKGPGLYDGRKDLDPEAVRAQLARPGQMIMVDDPRVTASELGRTGYRPVPLPEGLRERWEPRFSAEAERGTFNAAAFTRRLAASAPKPDELLRMLTAGDDLRARYGAEGAEAEERTRRILTRAWAAQRLGALGRKTPETVAALEVQLRRRSLHRDWMYHGLDGAMAARALGMLGATESAPALIDAFRRVDPELEKVRNPEFGPYPLAWTDFRTKMYVLPALGELRTDAGKAFLMEYLATEEARARELAPLSYEAATRALFRHSLSRREVEALLRRSNTAVRGTALLECLDRPTRERSAALKAVLPWAAKLPRAKG
jgi:glycerophosphoryl diester phosphodiesterase